jgi:hypothetical protein
MVANKICKIYKNRPEICIIFPHHYKQILEFPSCTYYFIGKKKKTRRGKCCQCGECCVAMRFNDIKYEVCPYLIKK